jgi:chromosome segregation ATPase
VKINIKRIEDQLTGAQQVLREYKKEIECLRQDVSMMDNNLQTLNDENIKVVNPLIVSNFEQLQSQMNMQRNENEHLQRQLTDLKKEKALMQQQIMLASQKIALLEEQVGL